MESGKSSGISTSSLSCNCRIWTFAGRSSGTKTSLWSFKRKGVAGLVAVACHAAIVVAAAAAPIFLGGDLKKRKGSGGG